MEEIDLKPLDLHPKDAVIFFKVMMRFEYALKECGFIKADRKGRVQVNWERYSNEGLTERFYLKVRDQEIAETLLSNPPSHQCQDSTGALSFKEAGKPENAQDLIAAVCRVRNNLFHGGKSGEADHNRNDLLITDALNVVFEALNFDPKLKLKFEGRH